jgi:large subunit ribosomal protein L15
MCFVNLDLLDKTFKDEEIVTPEKLVELKLIKLSDSGLKILGGGKLEKKLKVFAHKFSKSAKDAIIKKGGEVHKIRK